MGSSSKSVELRGQLIVDGANCGCGSTDLKTLGLELRCNSSTFDAVVGTDTQIGIETPGTIGQNWVELPTTDVLDEIQFLALISAAAVRLRIGAAEATVLGVGGVFPTGFVGAETLTVDLDESPLSVVFTSGAQSALQVSQQINAAAMLAGFAYAPASVEGGQVRLTSARTGVQGNVTVTGGTGAVDLGLDGLEADGAGQDVDVYGLFLNEWGKSGAAPERIQISGSAQITVLAAGTT